MVAKGGGCGCKGGDKEEEVVWTQWCEGRRRGGCGRDGVKRVQSRS